MHPGKWLRRAALWMALLGLPVGTCLADTLEIVVTGVGPEAVKNVKAQLGGGWVTGGVVSSERRRERFLAQARMDAAIALRPFGYYAPTVEGRIVATDAEGWRLELEIEPGAAVLVREVQVSVVGEGADYPALVDWLERWPLPAGARLVQPTWDRQKDDLLDLADAEGFLLASFTEHRIELDLEAQRADLFLVLDTGPRAVFGEVRWEQDFLRDHVLDPVPRFGTGDSYRGWLVDQLRMDLWRLGFFEDIELNERRDLEAQPPVVDLEVRLTRIHRATHQGTLGYGTDTDFRMQYRWQRHLLSDRGDSVSTGFGLQTRRDELLLFGEYRLPRKVSSQQYWLLNPILRREDQVFGLDVAGGAELEPIADGSTDDRFLRLGRARVRSPLDSREQIIETFFAQFLSESSSYELLPDLPIDDDTVEDLLPEDDTDSLAFGAMWDWPMIRGQGFDITGHRERLWLFTSNEAWGSEVDFTQIYLSSRWIFRLAEDWRLLVRGELGWSDAAVEELSLELEGGTVSVSLTELPFQYRFRTGGSFSVRGYDFESLSNNGIGSNNIVTASTELEYRFRDNWSAVAFVDTGNAFNDWSNPSLRTGWGLGIRWYTIAFPLRLDLAQALDLEGEPWQLHFTIGSPLF